jgi:hypothetical protein
MSAKINTTVTEAQAVLTLERVKASRDLDHIITLTVRSLFVSGVDDQVLPIAERLIFRKERHDVAFGMRYVLSGIERGLPGAYFREAAAKMERAADNVFEDDLPGARDDGPSLAGLGDLTNTFEFAWESACAQTELEGLA